MTYDQDAREFGQHVRHGGWRLGLLVARNCRPGQAGRPSLKNCPHVDNYEDETNESTSSDNRVGFREFAKIAGVGHAQVAYYYKAWQLAAQDGKVPPADELDSESEPLQDQLTDDDNTRDLWSKYLHMARESKTAVFKEIEVEVEAKEEAEIETGITPEQEQDIIKAIQEQQEEEQEEEEHHRKKSVDPVKASMAVENAMKAVMSRFEKRVILQAIYDFWLYEREIKE